jgi:hypothetical protein
MAAVHGPHPPATDICEQPVHMIWRPPTIAECLDIASQMGSVPIESLLDRQILAGLDLAVDDPPPDRELEPSEQVAHRTARMIDRLLSIAGLPEPARTIERIVRLTFERSGIAWATDSVGAALLINSYSRSSALPRELADHLRRTLVVPSAPAPANWPELFRVHEDKPLDTSWVLDHTADSRLPAIYLSNALTHLLPDCELHLDNLRCAVIRGLDAALARLPLACPVRLIQPSYLMSKAPAQRSSPEQWRVVLDWLLTDADALIISDVGGRAPGFGAGTEATVFRSQYGPALDVREQHCGAHSTLQDALGPALGAQVETNATADDGMAICCATWLTEVYEEMLAAHRRRENERTLNLGLQHVLGKAVGEAGLEALDHALYRSGLVSEKVEKILVDADHLGDVAKHQIDGFLRVLTARPRVPVQRDQPYVDIPALLKAGEIKGWSQGHMARLYTAAREELSLTGASHRLPLMEPKDWIMLDERLRG